MPDLLTACRTRLRRLLLPAALLALAGCAEATGPSYYLLEPAQPETSTREQDTDGPLIGLREVGLPLYARRPQIAVLQPDGTMIASDLNRWASDPARGATVLLSRQLSNRLGQPVVTEPWPLGTRPERLVQVEVDYFAGSLGGTLRLSGQTRVSAYGRGDDTRSRGFDITVPVADESYAALARAHGEALSRLAGQIAAMMAPLAQ
ncbi:membrane integrity-associated transporter subunit PqiC [Oceanicella sp. SM1341]|uniref:PqiC family protein n=1 Tax=Oceanicella sp. SM1341 TaxID=1548889 RepID=UPI00130063CC|nr:PqiC family protein [Oceanicella sp. SM1341]